MIPPFSRRDVLRLLGSGAGLGIAAAAAEQVGVAQAPGWLTARSTGTVTFPTGAVVRTVLADISPDRLRNGATMFHEHMSTIKLEDDPAGETLKSVAKAGAFIGFDTVGHQMSQSHIPERQKVARMLQLLEAGYEDHVLLSSDFAQPHNLKANWGNGFSSVVLQFVPKLRHAGVEDATLHKILVDNPRRFLAFVPKPESVWRATLD